MPSTPELRRTSLSLPWLTSWHVSPGLSSLPATSTDQWQAHLHRQERKRRLRLGSATRSHFPAPRRRLKFPHRRLHRSSKDERTVTTACPQPGTENGLQRPIDLEGQTRAQLIMARRPSPPKGRIHLRRLVFSTKLPLAVPRRTIHSQYQAADTPL